MRDQSNSFANKVGMYIFLRGPGVFRFFESPLRRYVGIVLKVLKLNCLSQLD
jgi:hypothetical protein